MHIFILSFVIRTILFLSTSYHTDGYTDTDFYSMVLLCDSCYNALRYGFNCVTAQAIFLQRQKSKISYLMLS